MTETPQHDGVHTENLRDYATLRRSTTDRKLAGVAGGLGRHLNVDPTLLRVLFVVLSFFGGAGLLLYGALWLMVPEEGREHGVIHMSPSTRNTLVIVAGVVAALLLVGDGWGGVGFPWPLAVVAVIAFVWLVNRERRPAASTELPPAPPVPPTGQAWYPPAPPRRSGPLLFGITVALVALALGVLGLADAAGAGVPDAGYPALALAVVGAMLVVGAWFGRAGGLVLLGLMSSFALLVTSATSDWNGHVWNSDRQVVATPLSAAAVHKVYSVPAGQVRLDLTGVKDLQALDGRSIDVRGNVGELLVILPANLGADVNAHVSGPGDVTVDGHDTGGIGTRVDRTLTGPDDVGLVTLNLDLSVGHIEVRQQ